MHVFTKIGQEFFSTLRFKMKVSSAKKVQRTRVRRDNGVPAGEVLAAKHTPPKLGEAITKLVRSPAAGDNPKRSHRLSVESAECRVGRLKTRSARSGSFIKSEPSSKRKVLLNCSGAGGWRTTATGVGAGAAGTDTARVAKPSSPRAMTGVKRFDCAESAGEGAGDATARIGEAGVLPFEAAVANS